MLITINFSIESNKRIHNTQQKKIFEQKWWAWQSENWFIHPKCYYLDVINFVLSLFWIDREKFHAEYVFDGVWTRIIYQYNVSIQRKLKQKISGTSTMHLVEQLFCSKWWVAISWKCKKKNYSFVYWSHRGAVNFWYP